MLLAAAAEPLMGEPESHLAGFFIIEFAKTSGLKPLIHTDIGLVRLASKFETLQLCQALEAPLIETSLT